MKLNRNLYVFIQENAFENVVSKMAAMVFCLKIRLAQLEFTFSVKQRPMYKHGAWSINSPCK